MGLRVTCILQFELQATMRTLHLNCTCALHCSEADIMCTSQGLQDLLGSATLYVVSLCAHLVRCWLQLDIAAAFYFLPLVGSPSLNSKHCSK